MSRVYKQVHKHAPGGGVVCTAGSFAQKQFTLKDPISGGSTVEIGWNGNTRTYTFVDDGTGTDHIRATSARATTKVNIGPDVKTNTRNLVATIHTNKSHVAAGRDDTIFPIVADTDQDIVVYSQAKIPQTISIGGTAVLSSTTGSAGTSAAGTYSTGKGYTGIMITAGASPGQIANNVSIVVRNPDTDGVPGAPQNDLVCKTVALVVGDLYPIETYGCNFNATVFG